MRIEIARMKRLAASLLVPAMFGLSLPCGFAQDGPQAPPEAAADAALLANVDKVPGFGGLKFGEALPKDGKFEIEQDRGTLKIYKSSSDKGMFGPAYLDETLYYVLDGKFYGVALHTEDGQDSMALKSVLIHAFGQGKNSSDGGPSTIWLGKTNGVLFDLNPATGEGVAFLFQNALHDEQLKQQSAEAKAAATTLIQGK
jgi:hypothetical protein